MQTRPLDLAFGLCADPANVRADILSPGRYVHDVSGSPVEQVATAMDCPALLVMAQNLVATEAAWAASARTEAQTNDVPSVFAWMDAPRVVYGEAETTACVRARMEYFGLWSSLRNAAINQKLEGWKNLLANRSQDERAEAGTQDDRDLL